MLTSEHRQPDERPAPLRTSGAPLAAARRPSPAPTIDFLGIAVRHKSLLALAITLATILGYILYTRQQPIYGSALKLMIWTNVPPTIVNSETMVQPVSVGKHQNLLVSEVVLSKAVEDGKLNALKTFSGNASPVPALRQMLTVVPVQEATDTLNLSLRGPNAEELPQILNEVVAAYQQIISEDAAAIGEDSVELIKKLQDQISKEKSDSEARYFELIQKLSVTPDPESGHFVNPHASSLASLQALLAEAEREHRDVENSVDSIRKLAKIPLEQRTEKLKAVALEASKYLAINSNAEIKLESTGDDDDRKKLVDRLGERIAALEAEATDADARLQRAQRTVGTNHPSVAKLVGEVEVAKSQLNTIIAQRSRIQNELKSKSRANPGRNSQTSSNLTISQFDRELIMIYLASLDREKQRLQKSIEVLTSDVELEDKLATGMRAEIDELNMLSREIERKDTVIREILDRISEMTVLASNHTSTKVRVIDSPGIGYLVEPKLLNFLVVSIFLGGVLGAGLGALLDWTELSFHNPEEIQAKLATPVIARIPTQKDLSKNNKSGTHAGMGLVTISRPQSSVAESYRTCRAAMLFTSKQQGNKTFLITSPSAGDGKTTTATNIAVSLAQGGYKTVLLDADLRRPRCHMYMGIAPIPGIKELSQGKADIDDIIQPTTLHSNLSFVGTSKALEDPSEFLESKDFEELVHTLQNRFDIVIIDSPPVLPVSDALSLCSYSDAVLLVLRVRKGVVLAAEKAMERLRSVEANVLGVVVNSVDKSSHYSDYGRYGYKGYGGYSYYAQRYYGKQNAEYYKEVE